MISRTPLLAALLLAAGCADPGPLPLPPAPVAVLTLDGKSAGGLTVRLYAADGKLAGGGGSGADGRAALRGPGDQPVAPGTYKVVVADGGEDEADPMAVPTKVPPRSRLPASYTKLATTPASLTVEAGKMDYQLALKSKS